MGILRQLRQLCGFRITGNPPSDLFQFCEWNSVEAIHRQLSASLCVRLHTIDKACLRLPASRGDWNVGEAVSQAYTFVLIFHGIGELHTKLMALSVQRFWFEPQLITEM
jgi:hypothetical protein